MDIGIVGMGTVGSALAQGFEGLGHRVRVHDLKLGSRIEDVLGADVVYVCVDTPAAEDGSCDTTAVRAVVRELDEQRFGGVAAVKSTVVPGTTAVLQARHPRLRLAHVPEFLRAHAAVADFVDHHDVCIIGTDSDADYSVVKASHGHLPAAFRRLTPTEAEIAKYFGNFYNAMLVTFANGFYELCGQLGADYAQVKESMVLRSHIHDKYLDCNPNLRGFAGACLPKDARALAGLNRKLGLDAQLFEAVLADNAKYRS